MKQGFIREEFLTFQSFSIKYRFGGSLPNPFHLLLSLAIGATVVLLNLILRAILESQILLYSKLFYFPFIPSNINSLNCQ